jgi:hypothetical protein
MRLNEQPHLNPLPKEEPADAGMVEIDDPLDLGFEHGNIVAYDDDFSFNMTVLSTGWKEAELD